MEHDSGEDEIYGVGKGDGLARMTYRQVIGHPLEVG
jgi:hypothetical protein